MYSRGEIVKMLIGAHGASDISAFAPKGEEAGYRETSAGGVSAEKCLESIRENISLGGEDLSILADIHPAWIVKALENESPRVIGIILRWLPSHHVRYIMENIPKRVKLALPKMVESFAVPTQIVKLIKNKFERKFRLQKPAAEGEIENFDDVVFIRPDDILKLLRDLGIHELAMAFQNVEPSGMNVLLNRMDIQSARSLRQRMKDVSETAPEMLKDAKYTILEVALDQEDAEKLLVDVGLASFAKTNVKEEMFEALKFKMDPEVSYLFKRYIDQYSKLTRLAEPRRDLVFGRFCVLSKAGEIS